jgi:hypothetical protein
MSDERELLRRTAELADLQRRFEHSDIGKDCEVLKGRLESAVSSSRRLVGHGATG